MKHLKSYKIFESQDLEQDINDIFINLIDDYFSISISNLIKLGKSKNDPSLSTYGQFHSEKDSSRYEFERRKRLRHTKNFICITINRSLKFQWDDIEDEVNHLINFLKSMDYNFYQIYVRAPGKSGFDFEINSRSIDKEWPKIEQVELIFEKI